MKKLEMLSLKLKNFKGIKHFELNANGQNVKVFGDNGTGKTTLFDAMTWLLFDKDSNNKKEFQIKTVDTSGKVIHGLDHEVEAVLEVDGQQLTLRKVYKEKWSKKRGSATKEFTGHTTDYYIDDVPVKKKEFQDKVDEIVSEDVFKLLTSPTYFNEHLHWQERRKILLEICGDISDEEVIASDKSLSKLSEILGNRTLEDHRKVIAARRSQINQELEKIPVRIDEVEQGLPVIDGLNADELSKKISDLRMQRDTKSQELSAIQNGGQVAEKTRQLREVEGELIDIRNAHRQQNDAVLEQKERELRSIQNEISDIESSIRAKSRELDLTQSTIERLENEMKELRHEWSRVDAQEFEFEQGESCPSCGQVLPAEQVEEARQKALEKFNADKAQRLESINQKGKALKIKSEEYTGYTNKLEDEIQSLEMQKQELEIKVNELKQAVEQLRGQSTDITENEQYVAKMKEKEKIEQLKADVSEQVTRVQGEIKEIDQQIYALEADMAKIEQRERGLKRIEELKEQERQLAAEFEKLEEELYLTEQFIRTKVNLLEEKINSRFKYARFKLFNQLVNGGVEECCETLYEGVPYSGGLNNAARINVGLDIINTLAEHYGFSAPIFIDNAEAVTQLIETKGQTISLVVSEKDKQLRVEYPSQTQKEAV